jgi:hypothetical protein
LIFRIPLSTEAAGVGEAAVSLPMLLQWKPPFGLPLPLYALAGIQPDVPVYTRVTWRHSENVRFNDRTAIDFGLVAGVGGYINDRVSLDARAIIGLAKFDHKSARRLNQFTVGMNYIR